MTRFSLATAAALSLMAGAASAQTEITWWHAMGGALGETVNKIATDFNASQTDYKITPAFKGTYEETLTAGIAAFRAGEQPNILQVFDAGAATVIGAKGATVPVQDLLTENGVPFDINDYISDDDDYKTQVNNKSKDDEEKSIPYSGDESFQECLSGQLHMLNLNDTEFIIAETLLANSTPLTS